MSSENWSKVLDLTTPAIPEGYADFAILRDGAGRYLIGAGK